jgi:hypothetical protein
MNDRTRAHTLCELTAVERDRRRPRAQLPLPIALVVVDGLEAAGLVPLHLEDLLTVDAYLEVEKIRLAEIPISPQSNGAACGAPAHVSFERS